jgi:hypothetical protein
MIRRQRLPRRAGGGFTFLVAVFVITYFVILILRRSTLDYDVLVEFPLVIGGLLLAIYWLRGRSTVEWDDDTLYDISFVASFLPSRTRRIALDSIVSIYGEVRFSGAVNKQMFVPFDTVVMEATGMNSPILLVPDLTDQSLVKELLRKIRGRRIATISDDVVEYIDSERKVF